ncbi:MAG: hypothetical protein WKF92_16310 [Pyrinomonadaceae bacterium]
MTTRHDQTQTLSIEFIECRWGLLFFNLHLGEKIFETNFSNVFDPLPSLKHWLEAVAIGVDQCSFQYDPEGDDVCFNFERRCYDFEVFSVGYAYDDEKSYFEGKIGRRQLVEAFYRGFLEYGNSPEFDRDSWAHDCIGEGSSELSEIRSPIIDAFSGS